MKQILVLSFKQVKIENSSKRWMIDNNFVPITQSLFNLRVYRV
jgi:hypothetical protein